VNYIDLMKYGNFSLKSTTQILRLSQQSM